MKKTTRHRRQPKTARCGSTLLELMISTALSVILVGGLSTSLFLASQAARFESSVDNVREAGVVIDQMTRDFHTAQAFSEWTATAVTFTVPDQNGDDLPETIRYSWSGVAGEPLVKDFNGQSTIVAEDVHAFDLGFVTKTF